MTGVNNTKKRSLLLFLGRSLFYLYFTRVSTTSKITGLPLLRKLIYGYRYIAGYGDIGECSGSQTIYLGGLTGHHVLMATWGRRRQGDRVAARIDGTHLSAIFGAFAENITSKIRRRDPGGAVVEIYVYGRLLVMVFYGRVFYGAGRHSNNKNCRH